MNNLKAFKDKALSDLRKFITNYDKKTLREFFSQESPWIEKWYRQYFPDEEWAFDSKLKYNRVKLKPDVSSDIDNAIALHESLPLSRIQAVDERLWVYLSMVEYWQYTRLRWELDLKNLVDEKQQGRIRERYLVRSTKTDRPFLRNSISRLWWAVEETKDENKEDPYELTRIVLGNTDIYLNVMERSFSRNEEVIKGILELISEMGEEGLKRDTYRQIVKQVNAMGGIIMLDFMTKEDLKEAIRKDLFITQNI
ncbi:DUF6339 family protein [Bacillus paralicheniformis]|uniref:DUF6339 family protein n=1 Tax=Bacillus paralicheniformis TaxID=1648923 RepID=UPI000D022FA7|nr:DUF6339 family protein [Bacillus paralicheniformis]